MGFPGFHVSTWGLLVSANQVIQVAIEELGSFVPRTKVKAFVSVVVTSFVRGEWNWSVKCCVGGSDATLCESLTSAPVIVAEDARGTGGHVGQVLVCKVLCIS